MSSALPSDNPTVSVIVPVYNGARFLDNTIGCLVRQTFSDFEIVACDDGSTDNSWEKLQEWASKDSRIHVFRHDGNQGVQATQTDLAAAARGEFIAQQDQDDPSAPDRLATQVEILRENTEAVATVSNVWLLDEHGDPIGITNIPGTAQELKNAMRYSNVCWHSSLLVRKSALVKVGGYNKEADHVADYDLLLRLLKLGDIVPCAKPLTTYGLSPGTVTYRDRATQEALARNIRHTHFGDPRPEQVIFEAVSPETARRNYHAEVGQMYLAKGKTVKARENLRRALDIEPSGKLRFLYALSYAPSGLLKAMKAIKKKARSCPEPEFFMQRSSR